MSPKKFEFWVSETAFSGEVPTLTTPMCCQGRNFTRKCCFMLGFFIHGISYCKKETPAGTSSYQMLLGLN